MAFYRALVGDGEEAARGLWRVEIMLFGHESKTFLPFCNHIIYL